MSTFRGIVKEFPDIRIDYFRRSSNSDDPPPRACFLSHIHSDHIQGLEGAYNAPFVYCSAATKELLVRLERRVHRLNYQKRIVESHDCRYKDKKRLLKVIPLDTPTWVEIDHDKKIRVTLFDANHCVGAVMFLIEEDKPEGKAILYTGDIRAEKWWVENLKRHPVLAPYTAGIKTLDRIYLDTSWGWRGYEKFASKRDGLTEMIKKMRRYPDDTRFHFNTWTFGYEELWVALAAAFNSQIHLSSYHYRLFKSISKTEQWIHGPFLCGFELGNSHHPGVITTNPNVRIHCCERGLKCPGLQHENVVYITPIVARINGIEVPEEGISFGDLTDTDDFSLHGQLNTLLDALGPTIKPDIRQLLIDASKSRKESVPMPTVHSGEEDITLTNLLSMFADVAKERVLQRKNTQDDRLWPGTKPIRTPNGEELPTWIKIPYSRHSSLGELRDFISAFRPRDVYPCVVDDETWTERNSISSLYGDLCSSTVFAHDEEMRAIQRAREKEQEIWEEQVEDLAHASQMRCDLYHRGLETQMLEDLEERLRSSTPEPRESTPQRVIGGTAHPSLSSSPPLLDGDVVPQLASCHRGERSFESTSISSASYHTAPLKRVSEIRTHLSVDVEVENYDSSPSTNPGSLSGKKAPAQTLSLRKSNCPSERLKTLKRTSDDSTSSPSTGSCGPKRSKVIFSMPIPLSDDLDDDIFTPLGGKPLQGSSTLKKSPAVSTSIGSFRRAAGSTRKEEVRDNGPLSSSDPLRREPADFNNSTDPGSGTNCNILTYHERRDSGALPNPTGKGQSPKVVESRNCDWYRWTGSDFKDDKGNKNKISEGTTKPEPSKDVAAGGPKTRCKRRTLSPTPFTVLSKTYYHNIICPSTSHEALPPSLALSSGPHHTPTSKLQQPNAIPAFSSQSPKTARSFTANSSRGFPAMLPQTDELIAQLCSDVDHFNPEMVVEAAKAALGVDGRSWWDVGLVSCENGEYVPSQEL